MAAMIGFREVVLSGIGVFSNHGGNGESYSPAKEKLSARGVYTGRMSFHRQIKYVSGSLKIKILVFACIVFSLLFLLSRTAFLMEWNRHSVSSVYSSSRGGYTVLINTWKRNSLLMQSVAHYASCSGTAAIHVVWSESDPPSARLRTYLEKIIVSKSQFAKEPNLKFDLNKEDNLNNRFKPIKDLRTDAIFSVDDDVVIPCSLLNFAFTVWQSASNTMVGFVPRMHWLEKQNGAEYYRYGGWWSVWWMGTYSMVLSKAAFFHRNYLDLYTYNMSSTIHDYVTRERNCEDIAMSLLIANASGAPPIWVKGKLYEIGTSGISSLQNHSKRRNQCLNDFISLYGSVPLISTNVKAVSAQEEWFW